MDNVNVEFPDQPRLSLSENCRRQLLRTRILILAGTSEEVYRAIPVNMPKHNFLSISSLRAFDFIEDGSTIYTTGSWKQRPDISEINRLCMVKKCRFAKLESFLFK